MVVDENFNCFTITTPMASPCTNNDINTTDNSTPTSSSSATSHHQYSYANSPAESCTTTCSPSPASGSGKRRGRGRPRKEIRTSFDEKTYEGLSPVEKKYKMLRDKNNEASRRSRMNRTQKSRLADRQVKRQERKQAKLGQKLKHLESLQENLKAMVKIMLSS